MKNMSVDEFIIPLGEEIRGKESYKLTQEYKLAYEKYGEELDKVINHAIGLNCPLVGAKIVGNGKISLVGLMNNRGDMTERRAYYHSLDGFYELKK